MLGDLPVYNIRQKYPTDVNIYAIKIWWSFNTNVQVESKSSPLIG